MGDLQHVAVEPAVRLSARAVNGRAESLRLFATLDAT
jgi:hypothetical protein